MVYMHLCTLWFVDLNITQTLHSKSHSVQQDCDLLTLSERHQDCTDGRHTLTPV